MFSRLKKAFTLVELVVSIALTTVIFAGVTGLLIYISYNKKNFEEDVSYFYDANILKSSITDSIDQNNNVLSIGESTTIVSNDSKTSDVSSLLTDDKILFIANSGTTDVKKYYFVGQQFGYCNNDGEFNNLYASTSRLKLVLTHSSTEHNFKICYGEDYEQSISFIKIW